MKKNTVLSPKQITMWNCIIFFLKRGLFVSVAYIILVRSPEGIPLTAYSTSFFHKAMRKTDPGGPSYPEERIRSGTNAPQRCLPRKGRGSRLPPHPPRRIGKPLSVRVFHALEPLTKSILPETLPHGPATGQREPAPEQMRWTSHAVSCATPLKCNSLS